MKGAMFAVLAAAVVLAAQAVGGTRAKDEAVAKAMQAGHRGKGSPFQRLTGGGIGLGKGVSLAEAGKAADALAPVADALKAHKRADGPDRRWDWGVDGYGKGLTDLKAAVKSGDREAADAAVRGMSVSCAQCHDYYYPRFGER